MTHRIRAKRQLGRRPHSEAREAVAALYELWCDERDRGLVKWHVQKASPSRYTTFVRERAGHLVDRRKIWDYAVVLRFLDEREVAPEDALKAIDEAGGLRNAADILRIGTSAKKTGADWKSTWQELKALPATMIFSPANLSKGRYLLLASVDGKHVLSVRAAMRISEMPRAAALVRHALKSRRKAGG